EGSLNWDRHDALLLVDPAEAREILLARHFHRVARALATLDSLEPGCSRQRLLAFAELRWVAGPFLPILCRAEGEVHPGQAEVQDDAEGGEPGSEPEDGLDVDVALFVSDLRVHRRGRGISHEDVPP